MTIGLLISTIALIPIVLALSMKTIYKESNLSNVLITYMIFLTIWQLDLGVLHFQEILNRETTLILFKLFRVGPTFSPPIIYYVAYTIIKNYPTILRENKVLNKLSRIVFNQKIFWTLIILSSFVYLINWTPLGIKGIILTYNASSHIKNYFPVYGPLEWLYFYHVGSCILFLFLVFILSGKIVNPNVKGFLRGFSIYSMFLYITGFLNFSEKVAGVPSSIGVIIFSTMIMREFIILHTSIKDSYYESMERQKKLDYTGNLAASLIHEVKNTNQIIKGFSTMLSKGDSLSDRDKSGLEMINKASVYLEELSNNYREYMKSSKMKFKREDVESIILQVIEFSKGILDKNGVTIEFKNRYNALNAYVNKINLGQVFINLIKNSVEAIPTDREQKKIILSTEINDNTIIIHFKDTGEGIDPDNWESVFDPFISSKTGGMGLGLPFVKKVIIEHFGNIHIVDSSSEGTHFKIEIPQNGILENEKD